VRRVVARTFCHVKQRQSRYGVFVVFVVAVLAAALTAQGWRSRIPTFDLLPAIHKIHEFVATGALPEHGDIGSYGSFAPPGAAWLMLPSALVFDDPRLSEYVGAALLHFLTLLGLFLLGRKYFSTWCGCLAAVVYGLSAQGLFHAGSLWPIGSPDMFVWLVYLSSEWVTRRDGRLLAGAIGAWTFGMYVDLALAPAIAVPAALWLAYRPPVTLKPLLAAAAVIALVWFPYLRFESGREFADLRSQLLLQNIRPSNPSRSWCNPARELKTWSGNAATRTSPAQAGPTTERVVSDTARRVTSPLARAETAFRERLLGNFAGITKLPGQGVISVVLLSSVLASFVLLSATGAPPRPARTDSDAAGAQRSERGTQRRRLPRVAVGAGVVILGGGFFLRFLGLDAELPPPVRGALAFLLLGGIAVVVLKFATAIVDRLLKRAGIYLQSEEQVRRRRLIVIALAVPWVILFAAAERGIPERFIWLWPLQALVLASFFAVLLPRLGVPGAAAWFAQALLVFVVLSNWFLAARVESWRADGWAGEDAPEVRVVDHVAAALHAEGRDRAAIGYRLFIYPFMANYSVLSPYYKSGAEFDALFRYRSGIENTNRCPEGVSPRDDYRVVEIRPEEGEDAPRHYFDVRLEDRFKLVRQVPPYRIFEG
jgi:hypothetical protein